LMSALHNLSRSLGVALLATSKGDYLVEIFLGCEFLLILLYKIVRCDWYWWIPLDLDRRVIFVLQIIPRATVKTIVDFSGCLHFRHPFELGGLCFR